MSLEPSVPNQIRYLRSRRSQGFQPQQTQPHIQAQAQLDEQKVAPKQPERKRSWIKSKLRPALQSCFQHRYRYDPDECFFPCPKITFLIDRPERLLCQICRESHCKVKAMDDGPCGDSTFAILPCGHVAGTRCLRTWLQNHNTCPFCRFSLVYPGCRHRIKPRIMTTESLYLLPRTLPDGGQIPERCCSCQREQLFASAKLMFHNLSTDFEEARKRYHYTRHPEDKEHMLATRERLEEVVKDEVYLPHLRTVDLD